MDNRRAVFRRGLHDLYAPSYDALCGLLDASWQPVCGLRSFFQQNTLYAQGRTAGGPVVTWAKAGLSFHQYGLASDWDRFDGDHYTPLTYDDPKWKEYLDACEKVGLRCIDRERPHNEYPLKMPVQRLLAAYNQGGMDAVNALLKEEDTHGPNACSLVPGPPDTV